VWVRPAKPAFADGPRSDSGFRFARAGLIPA
jgi:hypothetical protein